MPSRIIFAGAPDLTVADDADAAQSKLAQAAAANHHFTEFGVHGADLTVYVAVAQVAYVQEIPTRASSD